MNGIGASPLDAPRLGGPACPSLKKAHGGRPLTAQRPLLNQVEWRLHYGNGRKPMIVVVLDDVWPGMWRVVGPDGTLSDMANLTRAKDAAVLICQHGPPERNWRRFRWERVGLQ